MFPLLHNFLVTHNSHVKNHNVVVQFISSVDWQQNIHLSLMFQEKTHLNQKIQGNWKNMQHI